MLGLGPREVRPAYVLWDFPALSQTFVMTELRWLRQHGFDVRVYYAMAAEKPAELDFEVEAHLVKGVAELTRLLSEHQRTVMHSFFVYPAATVHAWPAARQTKIPFTFGAHAVDIFHHKNDGRNRIGELARDPHCLQVFVPGSFHRAHLLERGVPWGKITISPQAVDLSGLRDLAATTPRRPAGRARKVVTVARFIEKKGIEDLILAATRLADLEVDIDIYGYGPLEDAYRGLIQAHGVGNVFLRGPITNRADYVTIMREADLFIAPCVRARNGDMDGIPTVLMEAMALGVVVAASRVSSIPELVSDGVTGLSMRAGDADDIARTIHRCFEMTEDARSAMTSRAATHVDRLCSVERAMHTLLTAWAPASAPARRGTRP